jgi:hypothetical protein
MGLREFHLVLAQRPINSDPYKIDAHKNHYKRSLEHVRLTPTFVNAKVLLIYRKFEEEREMRTKNYQIMFLKLNLALLNNTPFRFKLLSQLIFCVTVIIHLI